ncbi:MAG TPA: hypothetical protein VJ417_05275, partial [Candidatus Glassbacteria bacterium]|nr:hypothetical protein [Candidatus Glassbacteria bacterium]
MNPSGLAAAVIAAALILAGCGGKAQPGAESTAETPAAEAAPAEAFDLMAHSGLDTTWGVFEGEYDEAVNDTIKVLARVRVWLEDGRITAIDLLDTAWVHPAAARLIPQRIIESQRLPVEAVSGASVASWTLMTATALALEIDLTELEDSAAEDDTIM